MALSAEGTGQSCLKIGAVKKAETTPLEHSLNFWTSLMPALRTEEPMGDTLEAKKLNASAGDALRASHCAL